MNLYFLVWVQFHKQMSKRLAEDILTGDDKRAKLIERVFTQEIGWSAENPRALQFLGYTWFLDDPKAPETPQETRALQLLALVLNEKLASGKFVLYGGSRGGLRYGAPVLYLEPNACYRKTSGIPALVIRSTCGEPCRPISLNIMFVPQDRIAQLAKSDHTRALANNNPERLIDRFLQELKTDKTNPISRSVLWGPTYRREIVVANNTCNDYSYTLKDGQIIRVLEQHLNFNVVFWKSGRMIIYDGSLDLCNDHINYTYSNARLKTDWSFGVKSLSWMWSDDFRKIRTISGSTVGLFGAIKIVYADGGTEVDLEAYKRLDTKDRPLVRFEFVHTK